MQTEKMTRFGVSMPNRLLTHFDELISDKGYANRSEALRDLVRDYLVEREWEADEETVGTVTIVYDHHVKELADALTHIQHEMGTLIISSLHVHLTHTHCLEIIVVRGKSSEIRKMADHLIGTKGVIHGKLTAATIGSSF
ncbi:putative nickel-responsive regulator [bacterium BMS3Abin14]|nr:putative nickel-responsive regulator [bacterium BMS3Abin14]HEW79152.1 nickel-responsive transcriptional regulator NikR [Phycisphaerales bacterium]